MKRILSILFIISLLGGGYWYFYMRKGDSSSLPDISSWNKALSEKLSGLDSLRSKGIGIITSAEEIGRGVADKFSGITDFLSGAPEKVSSTIAEIRNSIPAEALRLLSDPGSIGKERLTGMILSNATTTGKGLDGNICLEIPAGSKIGYLIKNPFVSGKDFDYQMDWGDGDISTGTANGNAQLYLDHIYASQGKFSNLFKLALATTTLSASDSVCVK